MNEIKFVHLKKILSKVSFLQKRKVYLALILLGTLQTCFVYNWRRGVSEFKSSLAKEGKLLFTNLNLVYETH